MMYCSKSVYKNQHIFTVWFTGISRKARESLGSNIFLLKNHVHLDTKNEESNYEDMEE